MVKLITKLYKYYIFNITIAIVFLIIGDIITVPPTFSKYFDNSITSQKLVAGFLEKNDVNFTKINAERDDKLKENVKFKSIDVSEDFSGIDFKTFISTLSDLHLENFHFSDNLSNTNMINSYFTSTDLIKKGNLSKANLATANLYGTNLTDADLTGADLTDADLAYADLINADLTNTILLDTNLTNADVSHAKFNGTFFNCASLETTNITNLTNQNIILLDSNFNKITSC